MIDYFPWMLPVFGFLGMTPKADHYDLRNEVRGVSSKLMEVQLEQREMKGKIDAIMHKTGATQIYNQQLGGEAQGNQGQEGGSANN